ncbi:MAG: carboxymuconolactone decarboxylase family protein [Burkholderiales bacterium]
MASELYDKGLKIRREVMSDFYVDRALNGAIGFSEPLQDLVTAYCWGAVWGREDLDRRTRSLINVAMLTALNRPYELEAHVRGALNNGCTVAEIRETLLQATAYCGFPAGIDAFRTARGALEAAGALDGRDSGPAPMDAAETVS